jgi:predicted O-methyltransferase YrrM
MTEFRLKQVAEKLVHDMCIEMNTPYFGPHLYARQGDSRRHIYMQAVVHTQSLHLGDRPLKVLEIGSWAGGSAITWGAALKAHHQGRGSVICVDPWRPYFEEKQLSSGLVYEVMSSAAKTGEIYELFLHNIKSAEVDDIVFPFRGSSDQVLPLFADGSFDIIFLDGSHSYHCVAKDIQNTARLLNNNGILCGDDLELQLDTVDPIHNAENCSLDYIQDPRTRAFYHPGVTKAVGEYFGRVSVWEGFWAMRRIEGRWDKVHLADCNRYSVPPHWHNPTRSVSSLLIEAIDNRRAITESGV